MKASFTVLLMLVTSVGFSATAILPPPSNPSPQVSIAWTPPAPGTVPLTNVYVWMGNAPRQYTTKTLVGNVTNATMVLNQRGVTYYITTTMVYAGNLESDYSNEISYTPFQPLPAVMSPPLVIVVQNKLLSDPTSNWQTFLTQSIDPNTKGTAFQLKLLAGSAIPTQLSPMAKATAAMRAIISRPPSPTIQ